VKGGPAELSRVVLRRSQPELVGSLTGQALSRTPIALARILMEESPSQHRASVV
jgi:hypothetical protein